MCRMVVREYSCISTNNLATTYNECVNVCLKENINNKQKNKRCSLPF